MADKLAVQDVIDKIRPHLQSDGGDVILVDVTDDGVVKVKLTGACTGCPMSQVTLQQGVGNAIKSALPWVKSVEAV